MRYCLFASLMAGLAFAPGLQANIEPKNFDAAAKPQVDFYEFANGGWIRANPVPSAYSSWGAFNEVDEHNKDRSSPDFGERRQGGSSQPDRTAGR